MDFYEVLGLAPQSSQDEVKQAYRRLSLKHHPDKTGNHEDKVFKAIAEAYDVLGDAKKKQIYDAQGMVGLRRFLSRNQCEVSRAKEDAKKEERAEKKAQKEKEAKENKEKKLRKKVLKSNACEIVSGIDGYELPSLYGKAQGCPESSELAQVLECGSFTKQEKQLFNMKGQESEVYHLKKNGKKTTKEVKKKCHRSAQAKSERPEEVTIVPGLAQKTRGELMDEKDILASSSANQSELEVADRPSSSPSDRDPSHMSALTTGSTPAMEELVHSLVVTSLPEKTDLQHSASNVHTEGSELMAPTVQPAETWWSWLAAAAALPCCGRR